MHPTAPPHRHLQPASQPASQPQLAPQKRPFMGLKDVIHDMKVAQENSSIFGWSVCIAWGGRGKAGMSCVKTQARVTPLKPQAPCHAPTPSLCVPIYTCRDQCHSQLGDLVGYSHRSSWATVRGPSGPLSGDQVGHCQGTQWALRDLKFSEMLPMPQSESRWPSCPKPA